VKRGAVTASGLDEDPGAASGAGRDFRAVWGATTIFEVPVTIEE
jgi:hypothetical protein